MGFYKNIGMSREMLARKTAQEIYRHYQRFHTIYAKELHKMRMGQRYNGVLAELPPSLTSDYRGNLCYPLSAFFAGIASIEYVMKHYVPDIPEIEQYLEKQKSYIRRSKTRFNECLIEAFLLNSDTLYFHYCDNYKKYTLSSTQIQ